MNLLKMLELMAEKTFDMTTNGGIELFVVRTKGFVWYMIVSRFRISTQYSIWAPSMHVLQFYFYLLMMIYDENMSIPVTMTADFRPCLKLFI